MLLHKNYIKFALLFTLFILYLGAFAQTSENQAQKLLNEIESLSTSDEKSALNAQKALQLSRKHKWPVQEARTLYLLACYRLALGDTVTAFDLAYASWHIYYNLPHEKFLRDPKMDVIEMISQYYWLRGKGDSLQNFLNDIENQYLNQEDTLFLANIINLKGAYHFQQGNFYSAIANYEEAISLYRLLGANKQLASCLYNLGVLQRRKDNHEESLSLLLEAVDYFAHDSILLDHAQCLNAIGAVLMELKEPERALKYQLKAYDIFNEAKDSLNIAITLNAIGLSRNDMGQLNLALSDLSRALKIKKKLGNLSHLSVALHNIGYIYLKFDPDSALNYLQQAESIKKKLNDKYGLSSVYLDVSQAFANKGDVSSSMAYLDLAEELAIKVGALRLLLKNYELRKELAQKIGNTERAFHYLEKYDSLNQEIYQLDVRKEIEQLEAHYHNRENEQQIFLQEEQIKVKTEQLKREKNVKTFTIIALIFSFIIIAILALFYRQKQKTQKLAFQQKTLEAELTGEEQERQRIAESLHDDIAGNLSAVSNILKQLSKKHTDIPLLEKIYESTYRAYQSTRLTSHQLAPYEHFGRNLIQGLKEFFTSLEKSESINILFTCPKENELQKLDESSQLLIYRSLQELTTNTLKHANASLLKVLFQITKEYIILEIKDNGKGIGYKINTGLGLPNLKRRIKAQNGTINIQSPNEGGTYIKIEIPLKWQSK